MKLFCPLVNGDCKTNCIFNGNYFKEGDLGNCHLNDAIETIRSLQAPDNEIDKRQQEILSAVKDISFNSSDIYDIKSDVSDIKDYLLQNQAQNQDW